jgi:hypothetical protein
MSMKILLVVQPERFDFYSYLSKDSANEYVLLWYEKESEMKLQQSELPIRFSSTIYWTDFLTPADLLNKVKPDKIIFYEIIDLRQIALIVSSKAHKIRTVFLEHGAAGNRERAIIRWNETTFVKNKIPYLIKRLLNHLPLIIQSKIFYYSVYKGFSSLQSYLQYLWLPIVMLYKPSNKEALTYHIFRERVPDYSIVFNELNFEEYELYTGVPKEDTLLTGVPYFDSYFSSVSEEKDHWVYIDHPHLEIGMVEWNTSHHKYIAENIFKYANTNKQKIYVKLHPRSDLNLWKGYENPGNYVEVIQSGDYTQLYLESKLILAFSSSLVTGFLCAKKNIVLLGWHPKPHIFGMDFSKTGLCHSSLNVEDLNSKVQTWVSCNLCMSNPDKYAHYIKELNFPFDGKATARVLEAINTL